MKKIILLISVLCLCLGASAQGHLKFKNIPIDGPKKAFIDELQKNDFHLVNDSDFGAALRGMFTGKPVTAFVMTTSEGNVCRVAVNYADGDGRELEAFQKAKARWYARFNCDEGTLHLFISFNPMNQRPSINLVYEDAINCERQDAINSTDL